MRSSTLFKASPGLIILILVACGGSTTDTTRPIDDGGIDAVGDTTGETATSETANESGGTCGGAPCTGAGMACDSLDMKCKPDGTGSNVGAPCPKTGPNAACGTAPNTTCNDLTSDGFPGGYCSIEPCTAKVQCPIGASCGSLGGEAAACWKNCTSNADCRSPDYECAEMGTFFVSGGSHKVCFLVKWPCAMAADCPASKPTCGMGGVCVK